jgi:hypothetical protein
MPARRAQLCRRPWVDPALSVPITCSRSACEAASGRGPRLMAFGLAVLPAPAPLLAGQQAGTTDRRRIGGTLVTGIGRWKRPARADWWQVRGRLTTCAGC